MTEKVILGTVQMGLPYGINNKMGLMPKDDAFMVLQEAQKRGITHIDTAAAYGDAEVRIGAFHETNLPFKVITKFCLDTNSNWDSSLEDSLYKMKIEKIDTAMFHSFDTFQNHKTLLKEILAKGQGKLFDKLGVSVYTNNELKELVSIDEIQVVQLPFNLLDNDNQRGKLLTRLKSQGKEIHSRSCFLQGLFFMHDHDLSGKLKPLKPYLSNLKSIADKYSLEIGHLAIQYALQKDYIDYVLFGVDSLSQLSQNIDWTQKVIDKEVFNEIDKIEIKNTDLLNPSKWNR